MANQSTPAEDEPEQPAANIPNVENSDETDYDDYDDYGDVEVLDLEEDDTNSSYHNDVGTLDSDEPGYETLPERSRVLVDAEEVEEVEEADCAVIREKGNRARNSQGYLRVAKRVDPPNPIHMTWIPEVILKARLQHAIQKELRKECQRYLGEPGRLFQADKKVFTQFLNDTTKQILAFFDKAEDEGQWLRTYHNEEEFETKEPELRFLFNGLMNCTTIHSIFGTSISDRGKRLNRFEKIINNDEECLEELLNVLRTGVYSGLVEKLLSNHKLQFSGKSIYRLLSISKGRRRREHRYFNQSPHNQIYTTLLQIATKYGISQREFNDCLTIPSTNHSGKRVFYPFHIWSVPFARKVFWDMDTTLQWAEMRVRMLNKCDRDAIDLDVNEKNLTPQRFLFEVAHQLCYKLQQLKERDPYLSSEKLKFELGLDPISFPIVPFVNHPTKATIGKYPQHGIAMETGYRGALDDDNFDPVSGWNKAHSTMQFTTTIANHMQKSYDFDVMADMSAVWQSIPWDGPLAAPCDTIGSKIWAVDLGPQDYFWHKSKLKEHIQVVHLNKRLFKCNECDQAFTRKPNLDRHIQEVHLNERQFKCNECNQAFVRKQNLDEHIQAVHNKREFKCDKCNQAFTRKRNLDQHIKEVHLNKRPFKCDECNRAFSRKHDRDQHIEAVHLKIRPFKCDECNQAFAQKQHLKRHIKAVHLGKKRKGKKRTVRLRKPAKQRKPKSKSSPDPNPESESSLDSLTYEEPPAKRMQLRSDTSRNTEQISSYRNLAATNAAIEAFPLARFRRYETSGRGLLCAMRAAIGSLERQFPGGNIPVPDSEDLTSAIYAGQQETGVIDINNFSPDMLQRGLQIWAERNNRLINYRVGYILYREEGNQANLLSIDNPVQGPEVVVWVYLTSTGENGHYDAIGRPDE
ncbi:hypothetical protein NUW58_g6868 [Xylaria curta]|uniref:Uncharacterized protein n=1 Tax=Xylaria curta TaxID=42375 RepID=A0ACC1NQF6_9PEZI|nr:hypothetical protein NUW58_g6868 [Xylaria curta]